MWLAFRAQTTNVSSKILAQFYFYFFLLLFALCTFQLRLYDPLKNSIAHPQYRVLNLIYLILWVFFELLQIFWGCFSKMAEVQTEFLNA